MALLWGSHCLHNICLWLGYMAGTTTYTSAYIIEYSELLRALYGVPLLIYFDRKLPKELRMPAWYYPILLIFLALCVTFFLGWVLSYAGIIPSTI